MAATIPGISAIASWSPSGERFCTSTADAQRVDITDRPYFQQAIKTGTFVNSGYIVGRISGVGTVAFVHPALDAAGKVEAVLILPVPAETLSATLNDPLFPPGTFTAVVDQNGIIAARWPNPGDWLGQTAGTTSWGQALARRADTFTDNGVECALVSSLIGEGEMTLVMGVPITPAITQIRETFTRSFSLMLAAFLGTALAGLFVARQWVGRPVRALQAAAEAMAQGNLKVRPPPASIAEVRALSAQFVVMAEALEQRLHQRTCC